MSFPVFAPLGSTERDLWAAIANNTGASQAMVNVTAICSNDSFVPMQANVRIPAGGSDSATAPCPRRMHVVGGGVDNDAFLSPTVLLQASRPVDSHDAGRRPDDGWRGKVRNDTGGPVNVQVTAICAGGDLPDYKVANPRTVPADSQRFDTAKCDSGTHVSSGGVEMKGAESGIGDSFPFDGTDANSTTDDGWRASANDHNTLVDFDMQVFAICV